MEIKDMTSEERLVAEQAVATLRALKEAAAKAPMGQGLSVLEEVICQQGMEHLRQMLSLAAASHEESQKKGSVPAHVPAGISASSKA
jgi:DNA topoisomerase VI subunit B